MIALRAIHIFGLLILLSGCGAAMEMERERRQQYVQKYPSIPPEIADAIVNGKLVIGMHAGDVAASIGHPDRVNKSTYARGSQEQWIYRCFGGDCKTRYLYLDDGKLKAWSDYDRP